MLSKALMEIGLACCVVRNVPTAALATPRNLHSNPVEAEEALSNVVRYKVQYKVKGTHGSARLTK